MLEGRCWGDQFTRSMAFPTLDTLPCMSLCREASICTVSLMFLQHCTIVWERTDKSASCTPEATKKESSLEMSTDYVVIWMKNIKNQREKRQDSSHQKQLAVLGSHRRCAGAHLASPQTGDHTLRSGGELSPAPSRHTHTAPWFKLERSHARTHTTTWM